MKILQINNYNYLKGGSEKVYQVSIELLKAKGCDVRYFSVADPKNEELCPGKAVAITVWRDAVGLKAKVLAVLDFIYNRKVARELDGYLRENRPDVAHLHIFYGALSNAIVGVLRKHKIPMVQSVHEFRLLCPSYTCLDPQLNVCEECAGTLFKSPNIRKRCVKSSMAISGIASVECFVRDNFYSYQENFAAFIMVSQFIQDKHIQYHPQMAEKCTQIYNSVDVAHHAHYSVTSFDKGDYYLYFGRLSYEKGVGTLIDVFAQNPHLNLKIAGTGPATEELKNKVAQTGIGNVEFLGFISGKVLYHTIAHARYTMIPSEWYENNPLSGIESLALGTPIIGSRIGGIPELIEDGMNGFLHESKDGASLCDALCKAEKLTVEEYEAQCKYSSRMALEKFDNEIYYKKLLTLYNKVANEQ